MMNQKAILFYNKMLREYAELCEKERNAQDKMERALYSDKRRKYEKVFQKMFGKPIDKATKL